MKLIDLVKHLDMDTVIRVVSPDTGHDIVYLGTADGLTVGLAVECSVLCIEVYVERDSKCGEMCPVMEITVTSEGDD